MYNAARWVGESIASVLAQDMRDFECLVIDDGSIDDGPAVAGAWAARDPRVRVVSQDNRGLSGARNRGIDESAAPHLLFLDADDWLEPGALGALLGAADSSPGGCVAGWNEWRCEDGTGTGWVSDWLCDDVTHADLLERNRFPTHALLLPRATLGRDRFDESLTAVEDWDMWLRLSARGVSWRIVERVTCGYRLRAASMSHDFENMARCTRLVIERAHGEGGSPQRDEVLRRHLLALATSAAVADPGRGVERACAMIEGVVGRAGLDPQEAAVAAHWMAPFALGLPPNAWHDPSAPVERLVESLARWWRAVEARGWAGPDFALATRDRLPRCIATPRDVARALVERAVERGARQRGVILVGHGQNGRLLERLLCAHGIDVIVCDDSPRTAARSGDAVHAVREPQGMPGAPCVVTPLLDGDLCERVSRWDRPVLRWTDALDGVAGAVSARLGAALEAA